MVKKRLIIGILCILFMFSLLGCQKAETDAPEKERTETVKNSEVPEQEDETEEEPATPEQETEESEEDDPVEKEDAEIPYPLELHFSSGAGAWSSDITLNSDGTFTGQYHDADMGDASEEYPHGTMYICDFAGKFSNLQKVNAYTYSLTLEDITTELEPGDVFIEDQVRYLTCMPYGLVSADNLLVTEYLLFLPNTPVSECSEWMLSWWPLRYGDEKPDTLEHYALYNTVTEQTFFTYPEISN